MIRSHFGLQRHPFDTETVTLLAHQQEIFDILRGHAQQGGLCLVLGEPGTGKSVLKQALLTHDPKRMITPVVNRTLHTYHNTLRILCEAFQLEFEGRDHHCERLLVQQAFSVHRAGKMLVPIIDDAHLMPADCLRKLRLLCEDFPRSHNLVLIGQPPLMQSLSLSINEEIRSRVTYSALLQRLSPEVVQQFSLDQLDRAGLGHNTFTPEALALVVRSGEGLLRRTRNLCLSALIEAVRDQTRIVDLKQVNRVPIQPRRERYDPSAVIRLQNTTPGRPNLPKPDDANSGKSTMPKKCVTRDQLDQAVAVVIGGRVIRIGGLQFTATRILRAFDQRLTPGVRLPIKRTPCNQVGGGATRAE